MLNDQEKQKIQAVLNTLESCIPVTRRNDVEAKFSCMVTLQSLLVEPPKVAKNIAKEENNG